MKGKKEKNLMKKIIGNHEIMRKIQEDMRRIEDGRIRQERILNDMKRNKK